MNLKQACAEARNLSDSVMSRQYVVKTDAGYKFVDVEKVEYDGCFPVTPENTVAYTWYNCRSRQSNKWSIQMAGQAVTI